MKGGEPGGEGEMVDRRGPERRFEGRSQDERLDLQGDTPGGADVGQRGPES